MVIVKPAFSKLKPSLEERKAKFHGPFIGDNWCDEESVLC